MTADHYPPTRHSRIPAINRLLRLFTTTIAVTAVALVATGCGSDQPRLSAEQYIAAADPICANARSEIDALTYPVLDEDVAPYYRSSLQVARRQLDELRLLRPDPGIEGRHERALELLAEQQEILQGVLDGIDAGNEPFDFDLAIADDLERIEREANVIARGLGLSTCGSSSKTAADSFDPEDWDWRTDAATISDGLFFFGENLDPEPSLDDIASRDHDLIAEADRLIAAIDSLESRQPPDDQADDHARILSYAPMADQLRVLAVAVESSDQEGYLQAIEDLRPIAEGYGELVAG